MPRNPEPRPVDALRLFIDGKWVESLRATTFEARNPANGQAIANLAEGTREDADRALAAPRKTQNDFARWSVWQRARLCRDIAGVLEVPVAPLLRVGGDEDILEIAIRNTLGLVSSVFTRDFRCAYFFAECLHTGIVNINYTSNYWELHIPFGGMSGKNSGIGRIGGRHTLMAMTDLKTVCIDIG